MNIDILKVALRTKFDESQIDTLLLLANETSNAEIAIAMLLDVYTIPIVPKYSHMEYKQVNVKADVFVFKSYDIFRERVTYTYCEYPAHTCYVNSTQLESVLEDLPKEARTSASDYAKFLGITMDEFNRDYFRHTIFEKEVRKEQSDHCSLSQWMKGCKDE